MPVMTNRITRVSTNATDPGYSAYKIMAANGIHVTLDGEHIARGFTADEVEGFVEVHALDAQGKPMFTELGAAMTETKRGVVRIYINGVQE